MHVTPVYMSTVDFLLGFAEILQVSVRPDEFRKVATERCKEK